MHCTHDWTIRIHYHEQPDTSFPTEPSDITEEEDLESGTLEARPVQMSLRQSRDDYDLCTGKFPHEVGEVMKPETRFEEGYLNGRRIADVVYNGDRVQRLMFKPDHISYGEDYTHFRLHDLQKSMDDGVVDEQFDSVTLVDAYQTVFDKVDNDLLDTMVFTIPENTQTILQGNRGIGWDETFESDDSFRVRELDQLSGQVNRFLYSQANDLERMKTREVVNSRFAVDFNKDSPLKAMNKLNQKFSIQTWVNDDGTLYVGHPEANSVRHLAAPDDDRVWRFSEAQISHSREPVKSCIVEGAWTDEPGAGSLDDWKHWFDNNQENSPQGFGDAIAVGIATRQDIDDGTVFAVKNTSAYRGSLGGVAENALRDRMKQQHSGHVTLDPELSNNNLSNIHDLRPGDLLHIVPDDGHFENPSAFSGTIGDSEIDSEDTCGSFTNNEIYLVNEVEYTITPGGDYQVHADVVMYPEARISTGVRYFIPDTDEYLTEEEWWDGDWIEDEHNDLLGEINGLVEAAEDLAGVSDN